MPQARGHPRVKPAHDALLLPSNLSVVIAGLDPAIHDESQQSLALRRALMRGTSSSMRGSSPHMTLSLWHDLSGWDCRVKPAHDAEFAGSRPGVTPENGTRQSFPPWPRPALTLLPLRIH